MSLTGARVWPYVPWVLLGTLLSGLGVMVSIATNDPSFALEKNYYQKAVAFDQELQQRSENARLGWTVRSELERAVSVGETPLRVQLSSHAGPVSGARASVEALRNASASEVLVARLEEVAPGEYLAKLPVRRGGLWELRFRFDRGPQRFTSVERCDVVEAVP